MGKWARKVQRNWIEDKYGRRMSLKKAKKLVKEAEEEIAQKTAMITAPPGGGAKD